MDLLIGVLMMLGVNCNPSQLNDQHFIDENKVQIEKATEIINSGAATPESMARGGIVITNDGANKN